MSSSRCMTGHAIEYGVMDAIPSYLGAHTDRPSRVWRRKNSGDPLVSRRKSCLRAPYLLPKKSADPHWWCIEIHSEKLCRRWRLRALSLTKKKSEGPLGGVSKSIQKELRHRRRRAPCLPPKKSEGPTGGVSKSILRAQILCFPMSLRCA